MCGINGMNFVSSSLISKMNQAIHHRGPNDSGTYAKNGISLGQVRLSILDLSASGKQPMWYTHNKKKVAIVFNGEIYNYIELKEELQAHGYRFKNKTDTEVIMAAYLHWGYDCVNKFNGMWAFALYDLDKKQLFCSRDRFGQKPFHYYYDQGTFIFSSEIKGILQHTKLNINTKKNINKQAFELYFALGYIPSPWTIYNHVHKLQASHNLIFDLKKKKITKKWQYYHLPKYKPTYNKRKLIAQGRSLIKDAIRIRMRSDVPVGAFLSGGLDSSTVVAQMATLTDIKKLHTFSIGFHTSADETPYINVVKDLFKSKHHHKYYIESDFQSQYDTLLGELFDEPFADYSLFPNYSVCQMAKKKVTVVLGGDGADEIFGGYESHNSGYRMELFRKIPSPLRKLILLLPAKKKFDNFKSTYLLKEASRLSFLPKKFYYAKALQRVGIKPPTFQKWATSSLSVALQKSNNNLGEATRVHDLLFNTLPDNFFAKVDRVSMKNGLEVRSPFIDYRIVEFGQRIPRKWKIGFSKTKILMRNIITGIVPKLIVNRGKQGFGPPINTWINYPRYQKLLSEGLEIIKEIDPSMYTLYYDKVFKEHNNVYSIYKIRLMLFAKWYTSWLK